MRACGAAGQLCAPRLQTDVAHRELRKLRGASGALLQLRRDGVVRGDPGGAGAVPRLAERHSPRHLGGLPHRFCLARL